LCAMGGLCSMAAVRLMDDWARGIPVCGGQPAAATITLACIHEHIDENRICAACATWILCDSAILGCAKCPSECCPCDVRIAWDGGPVKVVQTFSLTPASS
jgi:hypothetical protein